MFSVYIEKMINLHNNLSDLLKLSILNFLNIKNETLSNRIR